MTDEFWFMKYLRYGYRNVIDNEMKIVRYYDKNGEVFNP